MRTLSLRTLLATGALIALLAGSAHALATITIVNLDGPNEGFNDPTPVAPVGGNPGTTIGAQRLYVFQYAANIWGNILSSNVQVLCYCNFDPQTCDASGAVLGSTSAGSSWRDFPGAPFANTWYEQALANKLAGYDLDPTVEDMDITFNSNLGTDPACPFIWYYGVDGNEGAKVELLPVILHEIGHGLGFATITLAGVEMGTPPGPHVYDRHLLDLTQNMHWNEMATDGQRAASAQNCQNLAWDGLCVNVAYPPRLGPKPVLRVNSPASIAKDYEVGLASFGAALSTPGVTGNLVLVQDPAGVPTNGCETPYLNAAAIAGNVALVDRGACTFVTKALNCQAAGAIAVVVADSTPGCPPAGMSGADPTIHIPIVRITQSDGATIKAALVQGVNVTLTADPALDSGAKSGHVLVYTPIPFATGSSVSHWDTSAEPSLLMEPAITQGLSQDPDLTVPAFADIGWFGGTSPCGPTATTLAMFTAQGRGDGILLEWQFSNPGDVRSVTVMRSEAVIGPWSAIQPVMGGEGGTTTALDRDAQAGRDYYYRLEVTDQAGQVQTLGLASGRLGGTSSALYLGAPAPNPSANGASIAFRIGRTGYVRLRIVDVNGRTIRTLHEGMLSPGEYTRSWDGRTARDQAAAPGIYFVTLTTSEGARAQRLVLAN